MTDKKYSGDTAYVGETCATCASYFKTPDIESRFKNYCRGYIPSATAQNQWAYWPHVQSIQPACALWRLHPDLAPEPEEPSAEVLAPEPSTALVLSQPRYAVVTIGDRRYVLTPVEDK